MIDTSNNAKLSIKTETVYKDLKKKISISLKSKDK